MKVWQSEDAEYIEMPVIGMLRYVGDSFSLGFTDGNVYPVVRVDDGFLGVVDDTGEDYLYSPTDLGPLDDTSISGKWEVVEDPNGVLAPLINV